MNENPSCKHLHTKLSAKDNDAEYVECLDCGAILDARELSEPAKRETNEVDGSLSDA
jgi:Zn ribbon nucleic-acid-binding protein